MKRFLIQKVWEEYIQGEEGHGTDHGFTALMLYRSQRTVRL